LESKLTARLASIQTLVQFDEKQHLSTVLMDELSGQDRQQANEYVQGVLRRRLYLDFLIDHYCSIEIATMGSFIKNILRVGIYDLLFMDGTPDYAAINEAVEIGKNKVSPKTGDLINAILRKIQRELNELPKPSTSRRSELVAITFSHPEWMVDRWIKRYGERDAFQLMQANNNRPEYYIRVNTLRTSVENFELRLSKSDIPYETSEWLPGYFKVSSLNKIRQKGWIEKGFCQVQDIAAGFAPWILDPKDTETVYDLCAAPGTKTIVLADMMQNKGEILSVDINPDRVARIAENAETFGADNVKIRRADVTEERLKLADAVLLDAPCSGTGVLSKRADLRWRRTEEDIAKAAELQAELLDAAANMVTRGGRLVYSTCSLEPEENWDQITTFLANYDNFELQDLSDYLPEEVLIEGGKAYQTLPHVHHCDGHFGVLLKRIV
jgi:16S rRNA (cytosine967-C5)-methyltransferase